LTEFRKILAIGTENNMTHINKVCGNIQKFLDIAARVECSNYLSLSLHRTF